MRVTRWIQELWGDVAYALRQLKASPGFTAVAVVTLALGIGANSAMFALADATLLKPLPFPEPDRLVMLSELRASGAPRVNPLDFEDWEARVRAFTGIAAVIASPSRSPATTASPRSAQAVSARFFDVLGVRPIAGRTFVEADEGPTNAVVVMSEALWRRRFWRRPDARRKHDQARRARRHGDRHHARRFQFRSPGCERRATRRLDAVESAGQPRAQPALRALPASDRAAQTGRRTSRPRADLAAVADAIARESPATNKGHTATADPLRERVIGGELRLTAILLVGVVGLVLLMCCANVANLLLARASARSRVRSSSGARCRSCTDRSTAADREPRAGDIRRRRGSCYWRRYSASCARR